MVDSFKYILQETPLAWAIVGGGVLSVLVAVLVILLAARRGRQVRALRAHLGKGAAPSSTLRFGVALEVPAAASMLLVPALAVAAIALARAQLLAAVTQTDPSQKATFLAMGIAGQLNALCLGGMLVLVQVPLAALGLGLALGYRVQAAGLDRAAEAMRQGSDSAEAKAWLQHPGPGTDRVLLVALATAAVIAFVAMGFLNWATQLITAFSAVAGVDPAQKGVLLLAGMNEARVILERIPLVAAAAAVGVTVVAFLLLQALSAARARHALAPSLPAEPGLSWRAVAVVAGPCLVGAAACLLLVGPYRAENLSPLPVQPVVAGAMLSGTVATPDLQGPDRAEFAPLITIPRPPDDTLLSHASVTSPRALVEQLEVQRKNYEIIHPDRAFPGQALLEADRGVRYKTLVPWLAAARQAGYSQLTLAFSRRELLQRPVLGPLPRTRTTGARVTLVNAAPAGAQRLPCDAQSAALARGQGAVLLEPGPETAYAQLAGAAVAARRAGRNVAIAVPVADVPPP